jgi:hypothetical protein
MDRLTWAIARRDRYLDWCRRVEWGPYTTLDRLEFALISAHTPMAAAKRGFILSRDAFDVTELGETLLRGGVLAPFAKAAHIANLRDRFYAGEIPEEDYRDWRRGHKLPGLGYCKLSFGICLSDPIEANVVCLDTHVVQAYWPTATARDVSRMYRRLDEYERVEAVLMAEAERAEMPPFAYQWAVWDWKRGGADDHAFLWSTEPVGVQMPLFRKE